MDDLILTMETADFSHLGSILILLHKMVQMNVRALVNKHQNLR